MPTQIAKTNTYTKAGKIAQSGDFFVFSCIYQKKAVILQRKMCAIKVKDDVRSTKNDVRRTID